MTGSGVGSAGAGVGSAGAGVGAGGSGVGTGVGADVAAGDGMRVAFAVTFR